MTPPPLPGPENRNSGGRFRAVPNQSIVTISSSVQAGEARIEHKETVIKDTKARSYVERLE